VKELDNKRIYKEIMSIEI